MTERSCLSCIARKVCSSWFNIRRYTAQVSCEHGNYAKLNELVIAVSELIADNCIIYTEKLQYSTRA